MLNLHIRKGLILTLVLVTSILLVAGVTLLNPGPNSAVRQNGQGGPSEPPLSSALLPSPTLDLARETGLSDGAWDIITGSYIRNPGAEFPGTHLLGPLGSGIDRPEVMKIGRRETFYDAMTARGVPHQDIMDFVAACKPFRNLGRVKPGDVFRVHQNDQGLLRSLGFDLDEESHVTWIREGDGFTRRDGTYPVERRMHGVAGVINQSLYVSLQELGAPVALASKMNDILGWDLDFKRDLRKGDTFTIIFEEVWKDGKMVRSGAIEALEIVNRGKSRRAFQFHSPDGSPGYFDPDGKNMQKQLMRAPLNYSRISSNFSYRRFHPVLKKWMPHLGVDYAAAIGTPVRAGGDGVVVAATRKQGNGRYVHIRHNNSEYETYYLHLSGFGKGIRKGAKVRQGQVIGFVGATGYATGPHLDYRVKRNGTFVNPRKLKLPAAHPVAQDMMPQFTSLAGRYADLMERLEPGKSIDLALMPAPLPAPQDGVALAAHGLPQWVRSAP